MPTYEYACRDCGEHLEVVQSFKDEPLTVCGACGGALRKVFSAAGIIFKGSGYYVTDTRGKPSTGRSGAVDTADKPSGDKTSGDKAAGSSSGSKEGSSGPSKGSASAKGSGSSGASGKTSEAKSA